MDMFMKNPPSLSDVLQHDVMHKLFKWYLVSRYAPENLLFREACQKYEDAVQEGDLELVGFI